MRSNSSVFVAILAVTVCANNGRASIKKQAARVVDPDDGLEPGSKAGPIQPKTKSLIIGDSMSSVDRNFGTGLVNALSNNGGEACLFSVAGGRYSDFAGPSFTRSPAESFMYGKLSTSRGKRGYGTVYSNRKEDTPKAQRGNWSLENLLATNGSPNGDPCTGNPDQPFDNLIIELGTNHEKDDETLRKYLNDMYDTAEKYHIKNVKIVLPPRGRGTQRHGPVMHSSVIATIKDVLGTRGLKKDDFFDPRKAVNISNSDFADSTHFRRGSPGEKDWLSKVTNWLEPTQRTVYDPPETNGAFHI